MSSDYEAITRHNERQLGLDTASRRTQISMYSDSTHFLYELLQNADDYGATHVNFRLTRDSLRIEHNGQPFTTENVKAITYFGKSTSRDDLVKTGRFGVGFKSVFAITASPTIHSGDEHFEIHGLYRVRQANTPQGFRKSQTIIKLPFNHEDERPDYVEDHVSAEEAYRKIAGRLASLNMHTLLFTRGVREIRWETSTHRGNYRREDKVQDDCRWSSITDGKTTREYLVFSRIPNWRKQEYKPVEIAFRLDANQLVPIDEYLYVLFATTQETHLQFILNGPYRTNPSRETIAEDDPFNVHLIKETSTLVRDVLPSLRDRGLLSVQALAVFPIPSDKLRDFYQPLAATITDAFRYEALVPTDDDGFAPAKRLCQGPARVREVIDSPALGFFSEHKFDLWTKGVQQNSRPDHFLRSLDIPQWGWAELQEALFEKYAFWGDTADPTDADWISNRPDSWMQKFYLLLGEAIEKNDCSDLQDCALIRVSTSGQEQHVPGRRAYFPRGRGFRELPQVKRTVLRGKTQNITDRLQKSLITLGVSEIGDGERVDILLETFYSDDAAGITKQQNLKHIELFIKWWKTEGDASKFTHYPIFFGANQDSLYAAEECYLDSPLRKSGLDAIYKAANCALPPRTKLWAGYTKVLGSEFCDFAVDCGVIDALEINPQWCFRHPNASHLREDCYRWGVRQTHTAIDRDYNIDRLADLLEMRKREVNLLIWRTVSQADPKVLEAAFRPNRQYETRRDKSSLVIHLSNCEWIPDKRGHLHKPSEISKAQLHSSFKYDNRNGWLDEIGFAERAKEADAEYQSRKSMAAQLGVPLEIPEYLATLPESERAQEEKDLATYIKKKQKERKRVEQLKKSEIPFHTALSQAFSASGNAPAIQNSVPPNPTATGRRRARAAQDIERNLQNESSVGARHFLGVKKKWKRKNEAARVALKEWYGGHCQICERTFLQPNGQPYFEGLYLVPYTRKQWIDRVGNVVCVCPWHSAMFQFGLKEADEDIVEQIMGLRTVADGGDGDCYINMRLCGEEVRINFVEKHLIDLQEMIRASRNSERSPPSSAP